jgi:hypothetical protein
MSSAHPTKRKLDEDAEGKVVEEAEAKLDGEAERRNKGTPPNHVIDMDQFVPTKGPTDRVSIFPKDSVAGTDVCPLCAQSLTECPQQFSGSPKFSVVEGTPGKFMTLFGFPHRKNSCAFDAVLNSLSSVQASLHPGSVRIFDERVPVAAGILTALRSGCLNNWDAKKGIENALQAEVWRESAKYKDLIAHRATTPNRILDLMFNARCSGRPDPLDSFDAVSPLLAVNYKRLQICPSCKHEEKGEKKQEHGVEVYNIREFCLNPEDTIIKGFNRVPMQCPSCGPAQIIFHTPPVVLHISVFVGPSTAGPGAGALLPSSIAFASKDYELIACIYGDGDHFVVITKNVDASAFYFADSKQASGKYKKLSINAFREGYSTNIDTHYSVCDFFYVRQDHVKILL